MCFRFQTSLPGTRTTVLVRGTVFVPGTSTVANLARTRDLQVQYQLVVLSSHRERGAQEGFAAPKKSVVLTLVESVAYKHMYLYVLVQVP